MAARRAGKEPASSGPVLLVPELCTCTGMSFILYITAYIVKVKLFPITTHLSCFAVGMSEEACYDFRVMKDVAIYTRQSPAQWVDTLSKYVNQLNT